MQEGVGEENLGVSARGCKACLTLLVALLRVASTTGLVPPCTAVGAVMIRVGGPSRAANASFSFTCSFSDISFKFGGDPTRSRRLDLTHDAGDLTVWGLWAFSPLCVHTPGEHTVPQKAPQTTNLSKEYPHLDPGYSRSRFLQSW